jgi:hypothetical protein
VSLVEDAGVKMSGVGTWRWTGWVGTRIGPARSELG